MKVVNVTLTGDFTREDNQRFRQAANAGDMLEMMEAALIEQLRLVRLQLHSVQLGTYELGPTSFTATMRAVARTATPSPSESVIVPLASKYG